MTQNIPPAYPGPQPLSESDQRLWATLIHVGGIFFSFVPSLIGYLVLRDRGRFVAEHARTALNFQITMAIAHFANILVGFVLIPLTLGLWSLPEGLIGLAIAALVLIFSILAAIAASRGAAYRYPLAIPFLR